MQRATDTAKDAGQAAQERRRKKARRSAEMLVLMRGLARRYKNLVTRISKAELNASFIEYELCELLKMMEECIDEGTEDGLNDAADSATASVKARPSKPLRYLAETGAFLLEIKARPDGLSDIRIDDGKQFTLPPALADLMTALSMDNGMSDDAFVGWKTVQEIADFLANQSGRPVTKRAITQSVYRLRKELFDRGGVNPYLVQTNRRRGVRFALRRKGSAAIRSDR